MTEHAAAGRSLLAIIFLALLAAPALAQDGPHQKDGLWETQVQELGMTMKMKTCVSEESQKISSAFGSDLRRKDKCSSQTHTHNLDGSWTSVSTCTLNPGRPPTTSRIDLVGDFDRHFTMTLRSPPTAPPSVTMVYQFLGPCLPGQRGGDVILNGKTVNMADGMGQH
jgi:hypothetical protein